MVRVAALILAILLIPASTGLAPEGPGVPPPNTPATATGYSILGDADMASQASANGWPGSGVANDPILMQDIVLIVASGPAIVIEDVSLHFHIVNSTITGPGAANPAANTAIRLTTTPNAVVRQSTISGFNTGLWTSAFGVEVRDNNFTANGFGLHLQSGTTDIHDNLIQDGTTGIIVAGGAATATGNTVRNNLNRGIQVGGTSGTTLENNAVSGNGGVGIHVSDSNFVDIVGNAITGNGDDGLQFVGGSRSQNTGHVVASNTIANNGRHGILLSNSPSQEAWGAHRGVAIHANSVSGHATGIRVVDSKLVTVSSNEVSFNTFGVQTIGGGGNTIRANDLHDNGRGLALQSSSGTQVKANEFTDNAIGVELNGGSAANVIVDNLFDNAQNARVRDAAPNAWFLPKRPGDSAAGGAWQGGNFWSDYTGLDRDGDGLGEEPYRVDGKTWAIDAHPLA